MHRNLGARASTFNRASHRSSIASVHFRRAVNHHLRSVRTLCSQTTHILLLPFRKKTRRVSVLPAIVVPIVHMLTKNNNLRSRDRLQPVQLRKQSVRWRTTRTSLRSEQLNQNRRKSVVCRSIRGNRAPEPHRRYQNQQSESEPISFHRASIIARDAQSLEK